MKINRSEQSHILMTTIPIQEEMAMNLPVLILISMILISQVVNAIDSPIPILNLLLMAGSLTMILSTGSYLLIKKTLQPMTLVDSTTLSMCSGMKS